MSGLTYSCRSSGGTTVSRSTVRGSSGRSAGPPNAAATPPTASIAAPARTRCHHRRRVAARLASVVTWCAPSRAAVTRQPAHSSPTAARTRPCTTGYAAMTVPSRITATNATTTGASAHAPRRARHATEPETRAVTSMSRYGTTARSGKECSGGTVVTNAFQPVTAPSSRSWTVASEGSTPPIASAGRASAPPSRTYASTATARTVTAGQRRQAPSHATPRPTTAPPTAGTR
ncbi:hypothetical protein BJF88_02705 [Cellulosimicrobium sp. CUA-896]|nr:hypothetical protein BJF88_02705 [Cellulosimicrobium sp. CUA-896]